MSRWITAVAVVLALMASALPVGAVAAVELDPKDLDVYVTDSRGLALLGATISIAGQTAITDRYGRATVEAATPGPVVVDHARFASRSIDWTGAGERLRVPLGAPVFRAIHVGGSLPGSDRWIELLALADRTAVNTFMLDVKDESGRVFPSTSSALARSVGAAVDAWDLPAVVSELHSHGLSVITRIVAFQDPIVGTARPDMAVQTSPGAPFTRRGLTFLDPTDSEARAYVLALAEEACAAGVDEVQFDYVRFPAGSAGALLYDGPTDEGARIDTIASFLAEVRSTLPNRCAVAAAVFGIVASVPDDGGIGQQLESLATVVDVVSPMVYPDHWGPGWFGFARPADHPGEVVDSALRDALGRVGGSTTIRPWIQDFGGYGAAEVRAQVDAADQLGLGWMVWNIDSVFSDDGLATDDEMLTPSALRDAVEEALPPSGFWDVVGGARFESDVAWLGESGVTTGCNPPWHDEFCPDRVITRAEAATMLARALDLPESPVDRFSDDDGTTHEAAIDALAAAGVTRGCAPTRFCPDRLLTRAETAAFVARALGLPSSAADTFTDDNGSSHEADIERIAAAGITQGCGPLTFCPHQPVPREQVAAFLHRALG